MRHTYRIVYLQNAKQIINNGQDACGLICCLVQLHHPRALMSYFEIAYPVSLSYPPLELESVNLREHN